MEIVYKTKGIFIEKIKPDVYLVRGYTFPETFPGVYSTVCTIVVKENVATYKGFLTTTTRGFMKSQSRTIREFLKSIGCKKIFHQRIKRGKVTLIYVNL